MKKIDQNFMKNRKNNLSELTEIIASPNVLKDVVRGIFFYNLGHLTGGNRPEKKIDSLSQFHIRKISSVLTIQRLWKGYLLRKKMKKTLSEKYTQSRAVVKIQRWLRGLRWKHRRDFIFEQGRYLKLFTDKIYYIKMSEYLKIVSNYYNPLTDLRLSFNEQHISAYINQ